jgi:hypothetical protein
MDFENKFASHHAVALSAPEEVYHRPDKRQIN